MEKSQGFTSVRETGSPVRVSIRRVKEREVGVLTQVMVMRKDLRVERWARKVEVEELRGLLEMSEIWTARSPEQDGKENSLMIGRGIRVRVRVRT